MRATTPGDKRKQVASGVYKMRVYTKGYKKREAVTRKEKRLQEKKNVKRKWTMRVIAPSHSSLLK